MLPQANLKLVLGFALAVYAVLLTAAWVWGDDYVSAMLPLYRATFAWIAPDYRLLALTVVQQSSGDAIALSAQTQAFIPVGAYVVPPGVTVASSTLAGHALQHPLFLVGLVLAWPGLGVPRRLTLLTLALPLLLIVEVLDVPFVLAGALHETVLAQVQPTELAYSPLVVWLHFLNSGGRIVLSLAGAMLAVAMLQRLWPAPRWRKEDANAPAAATSTDIAPYERADTAK